MQQPEGMCKTRSVSHHSVWKVLSEEPFYVRPGTNEVNVINERDDFCAPGRLKELRNQRAEINSPEKIPLSFIKDSSSCLEKKIGPLWKNNVQCADESW